MDLINRKLLIEELEKELEWSSMHPSNPSFREGRMSGLRSAIRIVKDVEHNNEGIVKYKKVRRNYHMSDISKLIINRIRPGLVGLENEGVGNILGEYESDIYYVIDGRHFRILVIEEEVHRAEGEK